MYVLTGVTDLSDFAQTSSQLGSFVKLHMGARWWTAYSVFTNWLLEWPIIPERKLNVAILSPSFLIL